MSGGSLFGEDLVFDDGGKIRKEGMNDKIEFSWSTFTKRFTIIYTLVEWEETRGCKSEKPLEGERVRKAVNLFWEQ